MQQLSDSEKVRLITQLGEAGIISYQVNCLHEFEIVPNNMSKDEWYWLLNENYDITEKDVNLLSQCLTKMNEKGIKLAKYQPIN